MKSYSYSPLRYRHDPTSGEAVNVGVLVYAPDEKFIQLELEDNYGHLSHLFRDFYKDDFEASLRALKHGERECKMRLERPSLLESLPETAVEMAARLLPDSGGTLCFGDSKRGRGEDLEAELQAIFRLLVSDQRPEHANRSRRSEEDVWKVYRQILEPFGITRALEEAKVRTPRLSLSFKHTFQKGARHALQPLTLEYAKPEDIVARAAKWKAFGDQLKQTSGFGRLDFLLGTPDKMTPGYSQEHEEAVEFGIELLEQTGVEHQIVREDGAGDYAKQLAGEMRAHNLLD